LPELFEVFDFADPSMVVGRRNVSTVAPRLFLMNHPFVVENSRRAARRLLEDQGLDDDARLTRAYRLTLGRPPAEDERLTASRYLARTTPDGKPIAPMSRGRSSSGLFASAEFRYMN